MHENREISSTPWSVDQGRSAKAINHNADVYVVEKSHCAVVPVNQPNKGANALAEVGEFEPEFTKPTEAEMGFLLVVFGCLAIAGGIFGKRFHAAGDFKFLLHAPD